MDLWMGEEGALAWSNSYTTLFELGQFKLNLTDFYNDGY